MLSTSRILSRLRAAFTLMGLCLAAAPVQAQSYTLTILGSPGSSGSYGYAVNNTGQVAGVSNLANGDSHAFLSGTNGGALKDLGTLPGENISVSSGINNAGQVTGQAQANSNGDTHAFLSGPNGGALKDLGTLGGTYSSGSAVNDAGRVTGNASLANGSDHAFLSAANGGALKDLGTLTGDVGSSSSGQGVNATGQVAGYSSNADGSITHAFLSDANGGALKDLGLLSGFDNSIGFAVGSTGQVTGVAYNFADQSIGHAFLTGANGGALQDLGTVGSFVTSVGNSVNAAGQVVGYSSNADSSIGSAFLFSNGVMKDLNSLIASGSSFTLFTLNNATAISDTGFITGAGTDAKGVSYAYLLTPQAPVPEASTTVGLGLLLMLGVGSLVVAARRKRGGIA